MTQNKIFKENETINFFSPLICSNSLDDLIDCFKQAVFEKASQSEFFFELKESADLGSVDDQLTVAICYYKGKYIEKSFENALYYFNLAAGNGDPNACFYMGIFYENGIIVEQSNELALLFYKRSESIDSAKSEIDQKFFQELKEKADLGSDDAQEIIGFCFLEGMWTEKCIEQAFHYFSLSAEQNNPYSLYQMGCFYKNGLHVEKSDQKASYFFKRAVDHGYNLSELNE